MTPTIQDGDLMAIKEVELSDIEVGDILAVRFRELIIVHRLVDIIEKEGTLLRLMGDGNERPDQLLYDASQMIGKVVAVYPLRYLLTSYYGYFVPLTAVALLAISSRRRLEIDVNDVLLCLIFSLSMIGIIGYRMIGGA